MRWVAAFSVTLACLGCDFDEPLAPGTAEPLDRGLLGTWRCIGSDSENPGDLTIREAANAVYTVELGGAQENPVMVSAYVVDFRGVRVVNAQEVVDGKGKKWSLARYTLFRPTVLQVDLANAEPFRGLTSPEDREAALMKALAGDRIFEDYITCVRVLDD